MIDAPPSGHIKVSRKVFDAEHGDPFWMEEREFSRWEAWIDLIQLAAWKDSNYRTAGGVIPLKRGQFVASLRFLAKRWSWSVKKVRTYLAHLEKSDRVRAQGGHTAGTLYLITKYDAYQASSEAKGTGKGIAGAQQGHKIEAVKAVRATASDASASAANLRAFPKATCDAGYDRWAQKMGAMTYSRFRKELLPVFQAQHERFTAEQIANAVEAFYDGKSSDDPRFQGKWTIKRFASELPNWVRLGAMDLVDEWGMPTERGRMARVLAA